jgi:hypothetical protein
MRSAIIVLFALTGLWFVAQQPSSAYTCLASCSAVVANCPTLGNCSACATQVGQTVSCTSYPCFATCRVYNSDGSLASSTYGWKR